MQQVESRSTPCEPPVPSRHVHEREWTRRQNETTVYSDHIGQTWVFPESSLIVCSFALDEDYIPFLASTSISQSEIVPSKLVRKRFLRRGGETLFRHE